jgi:hypothetical protein
MTELDKPVEVEADDFTDELSDEALDQVAGKACGRCFCPCAPGNSAISDH